jgi:hypothetical protein
LSYICQRGSCAGTVRTRVSRSSGRNTAAPITMVLPKSLPGAESASAKPRLASTPWSPPLIER